MNKLTTCWDKLSETVHSVVNITGLCIHSSNSSSAIMNGKQVLMVMFDGNVPPGVSALFVPLDGLTFFRSPVLIE